MTYSDFIEAQVSVMDVPIQFPKPPAVYEPIYGGHLDLGSLNWVIPRYWDWPIKNVIGYASQSFYAEGLTNFTANSPSLGGPTASAVEYSSAPMLAESWDISPDGQTFTFHLRKGVHWAIDADGLNKDFASEVDTMRDLTAHDWVALTDLSFGFPSSRYIPKFPEIDGPESFKAIDDYTLEISLNRPSAPFIYKTSHKGPWLYGRQGIDARVRDEGLDLLEAMNSVNVQVGTGPFILTKWTPDVSVRYKANPNYWGRDKAGNKLPFVDTVELFGMNDERLQDAGFRTGKLGAIAIETCSLSPQRYWDLNKTNPDTVWQIFLDPMNVRGMYPNYGEDGQGDGGPFSDIRVRHAMNLAIDKEGWVASILGGWGLPYSTPLAPGNQWWLLPGQYGDTDGDGITGERLLEYDPQGAIDMLAEAGYGTGDITGTVLSSNDLGATWFSEAEFITENLRNVGIEMSIEIKDGAERWGKIEAGDFSLRYGFPCWGFEPVDWFGACYASVQTRQAEPRSGLIDLDLDRMIDEMNSELDAAKRFELVADLQRYLLEKSYYIYGTNWIQIAATQPWLKNYLWHYTHQNGAGIALAWIDRG